MSSDPWSEFSRDPRLPAHATIRAGDADRDVVARILGEAYAEGRLDADELDDRTTRLQAARTLGELPAFLEDLVPATPVPVAGSSTPAVLQDRAVEHWRKQRREAWWGLISVSAVVWTLWFLVSGPGSFPWPAFVTLAALLNLGKVHVERGEIVRRRLEALQRKEREQGS